VRHRTFVSNYAANRPAVVSAAIVVAALLFALAAAAVTPYDPLRGAGAALALPTRAHPFGTDDLGRDVLAQILYGTRVSLLVGATSTAIAVIIGVVVGAVAGYSRGVLDDVLMRVTELFQVIPRIFLAILFVALFGQTLAVTTLAIGLLSWPPLARIVRADFLSKREAEYVLAARSVGAGTMRIIFRQILPNTLAPIVVTASLSVGSAILLEASLAFIGLSDPNQVSLGRSLQGALPFVQIAWWLSVFPGVVLGLIVLSVNLIGDGINDALDPRRSR